MINVIRKTDELEAFEVTDLDEAADTVGSKVTGEAVRVPNPVGGHFNAREGDYIVKVADGVYEVYTAEEFEEYFETV